MPKKLSPPANKNVPVIAAEPSATEEQPTVSGVTNTATAPQTLHPATPLTDPARTGARPKTTQKSWAAIASPTTASSTKTAASASSEAPSTSSPQKSRVQASASSHSHSHSHTARMSRTASASRAPISLTTQSQKIQISKLLNELKQLKPKNNTDFRKITTTIYKFNELNAELSDNEKLELIDFISNLNLDPWSNFNFVHLFISLKYSGVFDTDISQDTEEKQARLFKKLLEIIEEVIHDPHYYHQEGYYSYLSRIIKAISTSSPSLTYRNKDIINRSLKAFMGYIGEDVKLNSNDIYQLVTSLYDFKNNQVITEQDAGELAKPHISRPNIVRELQGMRKKKAYLFACRHLIIRDTSYKNYNSSIEAIYNQSIDLIDPFSPSINIYDYFCLFDEINYLYHRKLINIENCNLEPLMKLLEGKIHFLVEKPYFDKFYISLYNLGASSFAKTAIYKKLTNEYHTCLNKNIDKISPANIAKITAYITKNRVTYVSDEGLDAKVLENIDLMLNKICSATSALSKENCLAALDVFSHRPPNKLQVKYFQNFEERIIPVLLNQHNKLTYNEKIQLIKALPLTKNERYDVICKQMIAKLFNTFMANTDEYMVESMLFLNTIANLGDYNLDITPFIELSRNALVLDETRSKADLFKSLRFCSFAYASFILQTQTLPQQQINSLKQEMKEKLALTISLIESQYQDSLFNDDSLMMNYGYALLQIDKQLKVNFSYTESSIQNEVYDSLAKEYELERGKDIQLEASLFGLPGIDIYLPEHKLAIEVDGAQHYIGANNKSIIGVSLIQKAILTLNGIHLINIKDLTRGKAAILADAKRQVEYFFRNKEAAKQ